jgi:hypothetical protein
MDTYKQQVIELYNSITNYEHEENKLMTVFIPVRGGELGNYG